jgi:hypothetical protein
MVPKDCIDPPLGKRMRYIHLFCPRIMLEFHAPVQLGNEEIGSGIPCVRNLSVNQ